MKINENIIVGDTGFKINEKNIICIATNSDVTLNSDANYQNKFILFDNIINQSGDKLSYNNNGVKINDGVSKVKVSLWVGFYSSGGNQGINIYKDWARAGHWESFDTGAYSRCISNYILEVEKDDLIQATYYFGSKGMSATIYSNSFMTVEVIE